MKHLSESILAKKTGIYGPHPNKDSIKSWLDSKGFKEFKYSDGFVSTTPSNDNCYISGPDTRGKRSNWIRVHSKDIYGLAFWFDNEGNIIDIEYYTDANSEGSKTTFEETTNILTSMVK